MDYEIINLNRKHYVVEVNRDEHGSRVVRCETFHKRLEPNLTSSTGLSDSHLYFGCLVGNDTIALANSLQAL